MTTAAARVVQSDRAARHSPAERFLEAWKRVEHELVGAWRSAHPSEREADVAAVLAWAEREHRVSPKIADFLQTCRQARNAYTHVSFGGYNGPVTHPPTEIVKRLERIATSLSCPAVLSSFAPRAFTCSADTPLAQALHVMGEQDFSQLPYRHPIHGWVLVTREQVSRWLEAEADADGAVITELSSPVRALADHPAVGPVIVRHLTTSSTVIDGLQELEQALRTPDAEPGGYPVVLVSREADTDVEWILTADDLPRLYGLLGR